MKNDERTVELARVLAESELTDGELESVAGGINPQPLPPGGGDFLGKPNPGVLAGLNPQPLPPGGDPRRLSSSLVAFTRAR